jgi:two-component system, OmpR family, response regulator RegX3
MRIAILEDDPSHTELLTHWVALAGHQTYAFERGAQLLRVLGYENFDALLLDWSLPGMSGIEVLREVRERLRSRIPIIFVTARDQEGDVVTALNAGADDYLVKPIRRLELLARLEAATRRASGGHLDPQTFEIAPFHVDSAMRIILREKLPLMLTAKDFDLAALLLRNVGRLLSRRYLLETIWGANTLPFSRSLDTHVSRVRNKLGLTPEQGWRLVAVYGYGYRLDQLTSPAPEPQQEE